jgi:hypothetical protein
MPLPVTSKLLSFKLLCVPAKSNSVPAGHIRAEGKIKNLNTLEDFKNVDKAAMLHTAARQVCPIIGPKNYTH